MNEENPPNEKRKSRSISGCAGCFVVGVVCLLLAVICGCIQSYYVHDPLVNVLFPRLMHYRFVVTDDEGAPVRNAKAVFVYQQNVDLTGLHIKYYRSPLRFDENGVAHWFGFVQYNPRLLKISGDGCFPDDYHNIEREGNTVVLERQGNPGQLIGFKVPEKWTGELAFDPFLLQLNFPVYSRGGFYLLDPLTGFMRQRRYQIPPIRIRFEPGKRPVFIFDRAIIIVQKKRSFRGRYEIPRQFFGRLQIENEQYVGTILFQYYDSEGQVKYGVFSQYGMLRRFRNDMIDFRLLLNPPEVKEESLDSRRERTHPNSGEWRSCRTFPADDLRKKPQGDFVYAWENFFLRNGMRTDYGKDADRIDVFRFGNWPSRQIDHIDMQFRDQPVKTIISKGDLEATGNHYNDVQLEDIDLDDYQDLILISSTPLRPSEPGKSFDYGVWLYRPEQKKFVYSAEYSKALCGTQFSSLPAPWDQRRRRICRGKLNCYDNGPNGQRILRRTFYITGDGKLSETPPDPQ